jgi:chemotaxis protein methyltransferase CheR
MELSNSNPQDIDRDFYPFILTIKNKTGIDLSLYKEAQMKRRLTSLREKRGFSSFESYGQAILKDHALMAEFLDRMTINVSEFFRNPGRWDAIETRIFPEILRTRNRVKCWSAACSTGEEPYTMAMILSSLTKRVDVQLDASDIDEGVLKKAQLGVYTERSIKDVPQKYLLHFKQDGSLYYVSDEIKPWVQYRQQNLLNDPFDKDYDLIVCRNVMIYFTESAKEILYRKFCQGLRTGGYLFVGSTEQIFHPEQYGFETADTFIYRKK